MTDIPKMLRAEAVIADEDWTGIYGISPNLAFSAADRIEKLEAALRLMLDNNRNLHKSLEELFAEFCVEAREALEKKDD